MQKRILSLALSSVFSLGMALAAPQDQAPPAQEGRGPGGGQAMDPDRQLQMMTKRLKLTDDQASQIRPILADRMSQMQNLRSDSALSQDDRRAKMRTIREDADTKINAVLNADQRAEYVKMEQMMRDRMRQRMQGGAPEGQPNQ